MDLCIGSFVAASLKTCVHGALVCKTDLAGYGQEHLLQRGQAELDVGDAQLGAARFQPLQYVRHLGLWTTTLVQTIPQRSVVSEGLLAGASGLAGWKY